MVTIKITYDDIVKEYYKVPTKIGKAIEVLLDIAAEDTSNNVTSATYLEEKESDNK